MVKGVFRFALVWALSMFLTPYIHRWLDKAASKAPTDSFLEDVLFELSGHYSTSLVRSFGETLGELVFGSKK